MLRRIIKAGEFLLCTEGASESANPGDICRGDEALRRFVTIPEGHARGRWWPTGWRRKAMLTGDTPPVPAEGSVLPQTYDFKRGETRAAVLARMQAAMTTDAGRTLGASRARSAAQNAA